MTILYILGGILLSYIAVRLWIAFIDTIIGMLKKLNPFAKKETMTWHTLDDSGKGKEVNQDAHQTKQDIIVDNERIR